MPRPYLIGCRMSPNFPVLLIGAEVLPWKITAQGWRVAPSRQATRAQRAPLNVIFARRENARREEDGPVRSGGRGNCGCVAAGTACLQVRACQPGGGAAPAGLPPGRARQAAHPGVAAVAAAPVKLWPRFPRQFTLPSLASRSRVRIRGQGRTAWRAEGVPLMTVKKVLTAMRVLVQ